MTETTSETVRPRRNSEGKSLKTTLTILKTTRDRLKPLMIANNSRRRKENFDDMLNRLATFYEQNINKK